MPQCWRIFSQSERGQKWRQKYGFLSRVYAPERGPAGAAVDWPLFRLDHPESRGAHQQLLAPSIWAINTAKDSSILAHFSQSEGRDEMATEIRNSLPRLCPRKKVAGNDGGLAAISPGFPGIVGHSSAINGAFHMDPKRG